VRPFLVALAMMWLLLSVVTLALPDGENGTGQMTPEGPDETPSAHDWYKIVGLVAGLSVIIGSTYHFAFCIGGSVRSKWWRKVPEAPLASKPKRAKQNSSVLDGPTKIAGHDYHEVNIILTHEDPEPLHKIYQPPELSPPGELPHHGDLPPGSHLPFSRSRTFTGREEYLLKLARDLLRSGTKGATITQAAAVATGLGGVGKTQLAIEFCYRYGRFFYGVYWIQADHDIAAEIAACGSEMNISPWPDELEEQVSLTLKAWSEDGPRLVVFDNVNDPCSVRDWLPRLPQARFLLTSRSYDWPPDLGIETHPLEGLPRPESLELLRKLAERLKNAPDKYLDRLADRLGDLPLALDLAGNYLRSRPALTPKEYLAEMEEAGSTLLEHPAFGEWVKHNPTKHSTSLVHTFALSWNQLTDGATDELAGQIFRACGYCAPSTPIPWKLLAETLDAKDTSSRQNLDLALNRLCGLGLIAAGEGGSIVMHPLLAEFARAQDRDVGESALPDLAEALAEVASQANRTGLPRDAASLREHLRSVALKAEVAELKAAGWLWSELGHHLRVMANYEGAERCFERGLRTDEKIYGMGDRRNLFPPLVGGVDLTDIQSHALVLGSFPPEIESQFKDAAFGNKSAQAGANSNYPGDVDPSECSGVDLTDIQRHIQVLGGLPPELENQLRYPTGAQPLVGALPLNEGRPVALFKTLELSGDLIFATDVNNLGLVLRDMGDLEGARENLEMALKVFESAGHSDVAALFNNLGLILRDMGDLEGARENLEMALRIDEVTGGSNHSNVTAYLNNLGLVLRDMKDLEGARDNFERALRIDEETCGPHHPNVASDVSNLGTVLKDMGDLEGARDNFERSLRIDEEIFGPDHPSVAIQLNNLGGVLQQMNDREGAVKYYEMALKTFQERLGEDHPKTEVVRANLDKVTYIVPQLVGSSRETYVATEIVRLSIPIYITDTSQKTYLWALVSPV